MSWKVRMELLRWRRSRIGFLGGMGGRIRIAERLGVFGRDGDVDWRYEPKFIPIIRLEKFME